MLRQCTARTVSHNSYKTCHTPVRLSHFHRGKALEPNIPHRANQPIRYTHPIKTTRPVKTVPRNGKKARRRKIRTVMGTAGAGAAEAGAEIGTEITGELMPDVLPPPPPGPDFLTEAWIDLHPWWTGSLGLTATTIGGAALWCATNYHVCKPNQFLIRTGLGIKDLTVSKSGVRFPFQKAMIVDVNPTTYEFHLHNMSKGKVEFDLPVVFTIGPILPESDPDAFGRYCKLLQDRYPDEIETTIKGIIEGETRGLTAQLTVEEMFNGKEIFRERVVEKLQPDLSQLGVKIYNANIQEMRDYDENNKYFEYRKQRAIEMANNEARRDVAQAQMEGDVAVSERSRDTRIAVVQNEKDAKVEEYARRQDILKSEAEMARQEAETQQIRQVSMMRAEQAVEIKKQELQREIEERRYEQTVQSENAIRVAPALAEAEARQRLADAHLYVQQKAAEAVLFTKEKEAEGIRQTMQAQAQGVQQLLESCQGNPDLAKFYLGNEAKLWHKVAEESAAAVQGMKPKITQWTTGNDKLGASSSIIDLVQGVVPLYDQVSKHFSKAKQSTAPTSERMF